MRAVRNLLTSVFAISFLVLGYCALHQVNAYEDLFRAYDSLRQARAQGNGAETRSLELDVETYRGEIDGNLKIYLNFSILSLLGIILVEHQATRADSDRKV